MLDLKCQSVEARRYLAMISGETFKVKLTDGSEVEVNHSISEDFLSGRLVDPLDCNYMVCLSIDQSFNQHSLTCDICKEAIVKSWDFLIS